MAGYFRVPMLAAQAVAGASSSPELLGAYLALRRYSYGPERNLTAAGAQAIRKATGCSDWRSKRLLEELMRVRALGGRQVVLPTHERKKNAAVYCLDAFEGDDAYLPTLMPDHML
ncbi:MAG: hypothetical protein ACREVL_19925, partial [Solimonas sp.]